DLTFAVFFFDAELKTYARYGGRDASGPDARQSLAGLRYTMESVLEMHRAKEKAFAPRFADKSETVRDVATGPHRRCYHCHEVREALDSRLKKRGKFDL